MESGKVLADEFYGHLSDLFRSGVFSVTESQLADQFYWLNNKEIGRLLDDLTNSGKLVRAGGHYTFSVFVRTLNNLYTMLRQINHRVSGEHPYSADAIASESVGIVHVTSSDRGGVVSDILKCKLQLGRVFLIAQERRALRSFGYLPGVITATFADMFTADGHSHLLGSISHNDSIVILDGNFLTLFSLYICVAAITQPHLAGSATLCIVQDENYDAEVFAGGFLRSLYVDLKLPVLLHSKLARNNPNLIREFVDGGESFTYIPLNEGENDRDVFLSVFKELDKAGLSVVSDVVYLSTVKSGRFSVKHIKWVMARALMLEGLKVIENKGDYYFIGERIRSKVDALTINYAAEYEIVAIYGNFDSHVKLRSVQDSSEIDIEVNTLSLYVSSSFIHVGSIAHQYYENGVLFVPLSGLHDVDDMDMFRFTSCFGGAKYIASQKVYLAHAMANRGIRINDAYKQFVDVAEKG